MRRRWFVTVWITISIHTKEPSAFRWCFHVFQTWSRKRRGNEVALGWVSFRKLWKRLFTLETTCPHNIENITVNNKLSFFEHAEFIRLVQFHRKFRIFYLFIHWDTLQTESGPEQFQITCNEQQHRASLGLCIHFNYRFLRSKESFYSSFFSIRTGWKDSVDDSWKISIFRYISLLGENNLILWISSFFVI